MVYSFQHAQSNLHQLISEAESGCDVVIERDGKPAVRLAVSEVVDSCGKQNERIFGLDRGLVDYEDSALDALSDEELAELGFGFMLEKELVGEGTQAKKAG